MEHPFIKQNKKGNRRRCEEQKRCGTCGSCEALCGSKRYCALIKNYIMCKIRWSILFVGNFNVKLMEIDHTSVKYKLCCRVSLVLL